MTDTDAKILWESDFRTGFTAGAPDAHWRFVQPTADIVANDAVIGLGRDGLRLVASGLHPVTGEPAFTKTVASEVDTGGIPGFVDHAKWIAYVNRQASSGIQGFDAVPGRVLSCDATISGRTYGTGGHPFGNAVHDPDDDLRLAGSMLNSIDPETSVAFDFILTNKRVYAFYGRTNFARRHLGRYASFAHSVPLADRSPQDSHRVRIAYDRGAGVVRWLLEGEEVLRVDRIGHQLGRDTLTLDEGGEPSTVEPRQLSFGMGMLTLLDGSWPTGRGLVRLSRATTYYRPDTGEPVEQSFVDEQSLASSRLFGQGAELTIGGFTVSSSAAA
ncbi:hypothetical protein Drose_14775 [Dactylosporangium roseum]|uniref:Uncharacterized protein n=1 Tax=Dactylosporangium roseum TaxID=47989 RepID=A0ABY5ZBF6_9ACTN|nr:DUF6081 family protein [Dactylosporangium roseum]UWZ39384.1 hypothetical protein Drose_14775 [Dactylosporangium roseum]